MKILIQVNPSYVVLACLLILLIGLVPGCASRTTSLNDAIYSGDLETARRLLSKSPHLANERVPAHPFGGVRLPLQDAVVAGRAPMISLLIDHGADVNGADHQGKTALHYAVWIERADLVKLLLSHGADVAVKTKSDKETPLMLAAELWQADIVRILMKHDTSCIKGLHKAVILEDMRGIDKLILADRASLNSTDCLGRTPLHYAVLLGNEAMVDMLARAGAKVDLKDNRRWAPIHYAVVYNNLPILRKLLLLRSDPNLFSKEYQTPLHLAADDGNLEAAIVLLEFGAVPCIKNGYGYTASRVAEFGKYTELAEMLQCKGE